MSHARLPTETPLHQLQHHTPDITYADDLNLLTTCPKQLQAQATKLPNLLIGDASM
jgi:hypothetical protein